MVASLELGNSARDTRARARNARGARDARTTRTQRARAQREGEDDRGGGAFVFLSPPVRTLCTRGRARRRGGGGERGEMRRTEGAATKVPYSVALPRAPWLTASR